MADEKNSCLLSQHLGIAQYAADPCDVKLDLICEAAYGISKPAVQ
jgi:hypothetical protein